jgi:hypothetical protein
LLCEQLIGHALRRQSYDLNEEGLFNVEYADVFGIAFDFTAKPAVASPRSRGRQSWCGQCVPTAMRSKYASLVSKAIVSNCRSNGSTPRLRKIPDSC